MYIAVGGKFGHMGFKDRVVGPGFDRPALWDEKGGCCLVILMNLSILNGFLRLLVRPCFGRVDVFLFGLSTQLSPSLCRSFYG